MKYANEEVKLMREIVQTLRSTMYSADEGSENWLPELHDLGEMIARFDGVAFDPNKNRLVQALSVLLAKCPKEFSRIEKLNDINIDRESL